MKISIEVPDEMINSALHSAGRGISYWCNTWREEKGEADGINVLTLLEHDKDYPNGEVRFTNSDIGVALGLMATKHPQLFADLISGDGDMWTGDVLVQLACFRELRFG